MRKKILLSIFILTFETHLLAAVWPGDTWQTASPESQGMSSAKLAQAPSKAEIDIGNVIVIRNGYANENEGWQIHLNKTGVWKGLPRDCYAARGACDRSSILVCPSLNLVIARIGPTSSPYSDRCVDSPQRWAKPIFEAINDKVSLPALTGSTLPEGEFEVGQDEFGEIVRINLNTIKEWSKVPGIKRRWKVTGPNGESRADHALISDIKDVDRDGKLDLFRVSNSVLMQFDENNNRKWKSNQLNSAAGDESRMPVMDLDGDGKYQCVICMTDETYCIDAATGNTKWEVTTGAEKNHSSLVVGHFGSKSKYGVAVRAGKKVLFYDCYGNLKSTCSFNAPSTYGHCMRHADLDGDGYDEVFFALDHKAMAVSHDGKILWEDNTQRCHSDWFCSGDVNNDGVIELVYDHDGCGTDAGPIYVVDGMTGEREQSWPYNWPLGSDSHCATLGDFRPGLPGLELARTDKQRRIELRDSTGHLLWTKIHPSTSCKKGDWDGDGVLDILVGSPGHAGGVHFSVWNGYGERHYAIAWLSVPDYRSYACVCGPEEAVRMCPDCDGNGRADVLVAFGKWYTGTDQVLCLMEAPSDSGSPHADSDAR